MLNDEPIRPVPKPERKKKAKKSGMKRVSRCKADDLFSDYIRLRDGKCMRCGALPTARQSDGLRVVGLQNSHYFGRRRESVRFDPDNCDALCGACHSLWEATDREDYRDFKIKQLGEERFEEMRIKSQQYHKRDRGAAYINTIILLKELLEQYESLSTTNE